MSVGAQSITDMILAALTSSMTGVPGRVPPPIPLLKSPSSVPTLPLTNVTESNARSAFRQHNVNPPALSAPHIHFASQVHSRSAALQRGSGARCAPGKEQHPPRHNVHRVKLKAEDEYECRLSPKLPEAENRSAMKGAKRPWTSRKIRPIPCGGSDFPSANIRSSRKIQSSDSTVGKASTSSTKGSSMDARKRSPPCVVCGDAATGIHFGADACAACSAFFRRTVSVKRDFSCIGDGVKPCTNLKGSNGCKSCRFKKCISRGMDAGKNKEIECSYKPFDPTMCVQSNRDSIGVYSSTARMLQERDTILSDLAANFAALNRRRLFLYSIDVPVEQVFGYRELPVAELKSISESLYQMTYLEPRLTAEFVHCDRFLQQAHLSETEMVNIFKNYDVTRQAIEEPFVTYKFGFLQRNCWVMLNRRYIDLNNTQKYFDDGTMDGLTLDHETAGKLFVPSLRNAMENVGARMQKHGITETEMIALSGVALYNPDVDGLSNATREKLFAARGQISRSLIDYYSSNSEPEPEVKLGTLYLDVYTFSTVHAIKTAENMHILDVFNIVPSLHERATRRRPKTNAAAGNVRRP